MSRHDMSRILVFLLISAVVAATTWAAPQPPSQPQPTAGQGQPGQGDQAVIQPAPRVDVNAAELAQQRAAVAPADKDAAASQEMPADLRTPVGPLAPAFQTVLDEERRQLQQLEQEFARAVDEAAARDVQRRIREVKLQTERRLLMIQLEAAQRSGDPDRIAALEQAVASLDAPRPAPVPVERDVPDVHQR